MDTALTLKNYTKILPKELILLAEKNKVRELDETEKGHFIAYVDDGKDSFDVSLTFLRNNEVATHSCDCKNGNTFCRHKVAILIHIAKGKKIKTNIKATKKASDAEILLEEVDVSNLKEWLRELFKKNKDIELAFVHNFSTKHQQYTPDEVTKLVSDAIKVVVGNKKNIDATQLKKLVELWAEMLAPVFGNYEASVADETSFLNFHTMLESFRSFHFKINSGSNKIIKHIEDLLQKAAGSINNLQTEEAWDKAIGYFVQRILVGVNQFRMLYLLHLKNISITTTEERRKKIAHLLAKQFERSSPDNIIGGDNYTKVIFAMIEEIGLFSQYYRMFKPLRFDNEFNIRFIQLLIENHSFSIAEEYCRDQIRLNYKQNYDVPYLKLLKEIYTIQKDKANLAKVLADLLPNTFDFDDYLFIVDQLPDEERKKWRTKILSRASNASRSYNIGATDFCFKLMDHEKNYRKMIDYIDSYTGYSIILPYFEFMILADKNRLMDAMLRKSDSYSWRNREGTPNEENCFPELFALCEKHFTANYLRMVIAKAEKDKWYYQPNNFFKYIQEQLSNTK